VTTLLESKARPYGSKKGAVVSMGLHGALIAAAVVVSGRAVLPEREKVEEHAVLYVAAPPPKVHVAPEPLPEVKKPPVAKARSAPRQVAPPPPRPVQPQRAAPAIVAPIAVPVSLPPINLKATPTVDVEIRVAPPEIPKAAASGSGAAKSSSDGDVEKGSGTKGGLGSGNSGRAYAESQVDRAVVATRPAQPRYPDALKSVSIQGEVIVSYIVDARGRVEPGSIKVISATHKLFADAVRVALLNARYRPAEAGGQAVRQLVEQPFIFKLVQ
jgi:TonB family protein